ncbi:MAG: GGDEF domain-containing protein [Oscillospiraceae bacterium]
MAKRRLIGVLTANPEGLYQHRILEGIFAQCQRYDYDVAVFSPLVQVCHYFTPYLKGELNIFELINFDMLDGLIIPPILLSENEHYERLDEVMELVHSRTNKPIVLLDYPYKDHPVVNTDDRSAFSEITRHILDVHKCDPDKVYFLTGMKDYAVSDSRLGGFKDEYSSRGLTVDENNIFYGDFWYSGGEQLADRIISGKVPIPQAVICASDHMAIGLSRRLTEKGINVPNRVIVTGYDATLEAALNSTTITTYVPNVSQAAALAVNKLRSILDPNAPLLDPPDFPETGLKVCSSCGCTENYAYLRKRLYGSMFSVNHNYYNGFFEKSDFDISILLKSYMLEDLTSAENLQDCLEKITHYIYLIEPLDRFYICLNENMLDTSERQTKGYPDKMILAVGRNGKGQEYSDDFAGFDFSRSFDTKIMLPRLLEDRDKPSAFFFMPVHSNEFSLGYAALECELSMNKKIGSVMVNWIRNVNNCLEMIRIREEILKFSERDAMTGLYNRRGMNTYIRNIFSKAKFGDNIVAFVIDMDGLKHINDTYGHSEGDYGINSVAAAVSSVTRNNEICVRAGGDEFYIIGVGEYSSIDLVIRTERLYLALTEINKSSGKPYEISASIGTSIRLYTPDVNIEDLLEEADANMYKNKVARKKQRKD